MTMLSGFTLLPWHWLALGVVLAVLEILIPGNVLIWFGIAALLLGGGMILVPDLPLSGQLGGFALLSILSLGIGFGLRRRKQDAAAGLNIGSRRFHGQTAMLTTAIVNGRGEVQLGDTVWPVTGPELSAGTAVVIVDSDGVLLTVKPASPA